MRAILGGIGRFSDSEIHAMAARLRHRGDGIRFVRDGERLWLGVCSAGGAAVPFEHAGGVLVADMTVYDRGGAMPEETCHERAILESSRNEGLGMLDHLEARYALALWDRDRRSLALARDFMGEAPLYYGRDAKGRFLFASEYKAILADDDVAADADPVMLQYLQQTKLPAEGRTLFRDIQSVRGGEVIRIDEDGSVTGSQMISGIPVDVRDGDEGEFAERVRLAVLDAIRVRVKDRTKIGLALSGGLDSISLAFALRAANPAMEILTFTASHGPEDPEEQVAAEVSRRIGAKHHSIVVRADEVERSLREMAWHLEDPVARSESLQFFVLARKAAGHVDAMLTGAAADGMFAGQQKHKLLWGMQRLPLLRRALGDFYILSQIGRWPESAGGRLLAAAYFRGRLPRVPRVHGAGGDVVPFRFPPMTAEFLNDVSQRSCQPGASRWMMKIERMFAAFGIEHVAPFCDRRLQRLAFTIPSRLKIRGGVEKYILRRAMQPLVPGDILRVRKFAMRMNYNLAFAESLDRVCDRYIGPEQLAARGWFDPDEIRELRKRDKSRPYTSEHAMRLWTVLLTELWGVQFLDGRGRPPLRRSPDYR